MSAELIYNLVYDYYETRIAMGVYRCGDILPSIPKIAEGFQMAPLTVRSALTRLEKKGYIRIVPRKPAEVIYRIDESHVRQNAASYFVPRMAGLIDFCQSGKLLIEPVWEYAQFNLSEEKRLFLKSKLAEAGKVELPVSVRHHLYVFAALKNKLFLNFYWEVLRYMRFPYLASNSTHQERDQVFLFNKNENQIEFMKEAFEGDYGNSLKYLQDFCLWAQKEYDLEDKEQIPFCWNIYWQRPQLCYTLVSHIILEIIRGTYPEGSVLPSMPIMSKQLKVSYRTLRRTLSILGSLGVIRLHQGKAAEVCTDIEQIDFSRQEIKEGARLYRESLQFMAITIRPVLLFTLENARKEDQEYLADAFAQMLRQNTCHKCFKITIGFIIEKCPSATVRECYRKLSEFMVWGYPFTRYRVKKQQLKNEYASMVQRAAPCLKDGDWACFADYWKDLMACEQQKAEHFLFKNNIRL